MKKIIKATMPEMASYEAYIEEIKSIWDDGAMTNNGPKARKFREELISYMGCENAEVFVNGHSALLAAIKSLDLPVGGEVLTSPFTFVSTTNAIVQCGLIPVFCDIDDSYNISVESIKRNITKNTCAIITPHIFGIPCHIDEIQKIADNYGIKVIYDGAQAFGTKVNGTNIGNFGDITMFSFHAIKIFNAIEGGALSYRDASLREKLELYRNFGIVYGETTDVAVEGFNAKMTEFSAAMGLVNLPYLDENIAKRKKLAEYYMKVLSEIPGINTYNYDRAIDYNYAYFPVLIDEKKTKKTRDQIREMLAAEGVQTRKLYDMLTCDYTIYRDADYKRDTKYAEQIAKKCIDFPIYTELTYDDIGRIGSILKEII